MNVQLPKLPLVPQFPNMLSHSLRSEGESPRKTWIAVMEYPDCQREYDGKNWSITKDYRK